MSTLKNPKFQLAASFIAMMMVGNLQYTWTLFVEPIREGRSWQLTGIQFAYTIYIAVQTWIQPATGWFIDRIGQRPFITVAGLLAGVGWSMIGHATSLPQLYIFYGMAGVGAAFVYSGSMGSALKWFPNRRGFASGVIAAGYGGGSAISVWIIRYLIRDYSYMTAFLASGIFQGIVIVIVAQFLRHPEKDFIAPKAAAPSPVAVTKSRKGTDNFTSMEMLATPQFYILFVMFVAVGVGGLFLTANSGSMARSWGLSATLTAAASFGLLANAGSRPFWGWVSDKWGRENTMVVAFVLQAISLVCLGTYGKGSGVLFAATLILTYFTWGEIYALFPATVGDYFGSKYATSNNSFLYAAKGVAALVIFLLQYVHQYFDSWSAALYASAILAMLTAIAAFAIRHMPLPKKGSQRSMAAASS
jgi:OFA family oxalate/formate antiporter-like MFS transporter